ncbi:hypothetical protein MettiDRAFT_1730 [Methanolobus tindarius DSM 2278]|uniref:Uncharacterized protein n=1 Tax=Methanolobus tindarius DSM 2278 TaxID=1090322 RepID=W9DX55_METTI|nr:hypothetical protein [Methanolobus tindarius]ETA68272.1 hypothetical protein MettiDRAFT_1730 [Methanolobus tindarius DSM 2278]
MKRRSFSIGKNYVAQIYTLEALIAATIIVGVLIFSIQATSLTPLTSSTANAHVETHLYTIGQDILNSLDYSQNDEDSDLKKDILNWDGDSYSWNSVTYVRTNKTLVNSSTADMLETIIVPRGIAHNVEITWIDNNGNTIVLPYIYNGEPSNNAVVVSKKVLLSDSDMQTPSQFATTTGIGDMDTNTDFYSLIDVRLTLWRM